MSTVRSQRGLIRVGTRKYLKHFNSHIKKWENYKDPSFPTFVNCVCLTASTEYGTLGPYVLRVIEEGPEKGSLIENAWQSSKIVPHVPTVNASISQYNKTIAWSWPADKYVDEKTGEVNMSKWLKWHDALAHCKYPIRYPFTFSPQIRATTMGVLAPELLQKYRNDPQNTKINAKTDLLGIAEGRKQVYCRYYVAAVKEAPLYQKLKAMLDSGVNLMLIDIDGSIESSIPYYKQKYNVPDDWIQNDSIEINRENLRILINDTKHSFGHTFALAAALLGIEDEVL